MGDTRRRGRPRKAEPDTKALSAARDHAAAMIRLRQRVHELTSELETALLLVDERGYYVDEEPDVVEGLRRELRRFRGGANACCPLIHIDTADGSIDRAALHHARMRLGYSQAQAESVASRGYLSKPLEGDFDRLAARCDSCMTDDAKATAAVRVHDGKRFLVEKRRLCIDCYDRAITTDGL